MAGSQFLEGGCWKRGGDFFEQGEGGIAVAHKKKIKSGILNDNSNNNKYKPKCLSAISKNLNWQILTKNLVTFKR